jgi:hypothetical protein
LRLGHDVRLIAPQYVKPYVKRQKNDAKDAEAIAEAASRPTMRFATAKTTTQQGQAMVLKTRDLLTAQRSQTINALRGHLAEYGRVAPKGPQHLSPLEGALAENAERLPSDVTNLCQIFFDLIDGLSGRIDALTRQLRQVARHNDVARRLMTMPGIGPVASFWSCRLGMSVCSCIPATMLDSQDESLTGFVQQSHSHAKAPHSTTPSSSTWIRAASISTSWQTGIPIRWGRNAARAATRWRAITRSNCATWPPSTPIC